MIGRAVTDDTKGNYALLPCSMYFFFSSTFFISHFPTPNFFFFIIFKTITIQKHFFFVKHLGIDHQKKKLYRLSRAFFRLLFDVTIIFFFLFSH